MTMFIADYPGAIVVPSHPTNQHTPESHGGVPNKPKVFVLHTPEEDADDDAGTPYYFANNANLEASTHYFSAFDPPDIYQCVPERNYAYANGVTPPMPYPKDTSNATSLNWQSLSVEIEGRALTIHETLIVGGPQWKSLISLIRHRCKAHGIPMDRDHIIGHYQVSNQRSDPGPKFPWDALIRDLNTEDDVRVEHSVVAAFLSDNTFNGTNDFVGDQYVNAQIDFKLPPEAKYVEIEFLARHGYATVISGNGVECGKIGWGTTKGAASRETCIVGLSDLEPKGRTGRWFHITAPEAGNPLFLYGARSIAYYT